MATGDPEDQFSKKKPAEKRSRPIRLKPAGKRQLKYEQSLGEGPEQKRIHPRRPLPPVPEAPREETEKGQ
jgi:hypothetical protein